MAEEEPKEKKDKQEPKETEQQQMEHHEQEDDDEPFVYTGGEGPKDNRLIAIGEKVKEVEIQAFEENKVLVSLDFRKAISLVEIGLAAFQGCSSLTYLDLSEATKLRIIETRAFLGCTSLIVFIAPKGLIKIGDSSFSECKALKSIELNDGLEHIGNAAFFFCESLETACIPSSVNFFAASIFHLCDNLRSIDIIHGDNLQLAILLCVEHQRNQTKELEKRLVHMYSKQPIDSSQLDNEKQVEKLNQVMLSHSLLETKDRKLQLKDLDRFQAVLQQDNFRKVVIDNLDQPVIREWLNKKSCGRKVVFFLMTELYLHFAWIFSFVKVSRLKVTGSQEDATGLLIGLLIVATAFFYLEIRQFYNWKTQYVQSLWNWIELCTIGLVIASVVKLWSYKNYPIDTDLRSLLTTTGFFIFLSFVSYLKKTFIPFATFVGGVTQIFSTLIPFLVSTAITLFAFTFMYYVQYHPAAEYQTLGESFLTIYGFFVGGPDGTTGLLDIFYGIVVVIMLLNVVIAIVSSAWEEATAGAAKVFWAYRLEFIQDVTGRTENQYSKKFFKWMDTLGFVGEDEHEGFGLFDGFGLSFAFDRPAGEQFFELMAKNYQNEGAFISALITLYSILFFTVFILLGVCTAGLFSPMYMRQLLFASQSTTESTLDDKVDSMKKQMEANTKQLEEKVEAKTKEMKEDFQAQTKQMEERFEAKTKEMKEDFQAQTKQLEERMTKQLEQILQILAPSKKEDEDSLPITPAETGTKRIDHAGEDDELTL